MIKTKLKLVNQPCVGCYFRGKCSRHRLPIICNMIISDFLRVKGSDKFPIYIKVEENVSVALIDDDDLYEEEEDLYEEEEDES